MFLDFRRLSTENYVRKQEKYKLDSEYAHKNAQESCHKRDSRLSVLSLVTILSGFEINNFAGSR